MLFGAFLLLTATVTDAAKMLHNPLRVRVNSELIKSVFHKKDQDILNVLKDIELGTYSLGDSSIKGLQVSFEPLSGNVEDFDYKLSLDQSKFLGIESDNIKIRGSGQIVHAGQETAEPFTVEGPASAFRVHFQVGQEEGEKKIEFKGIDLSFSNEQLKIESSSPVFGEHGHADQLKTWMQARLVDELHNIKNEALKGDD
jgi:hypothetical protein